MKVFVFVAYQGRYAAVITRSGLSEIQWLIDRAEFFADAHALGSESAADRLFPVASTDDEVAAEFAKYTFEDMKLARRDRFAWLRDVFSDDVPTIETKDAPTMAAGLNDLRLVLDRAAELGMLADEEAWPELRRKFEQMRRQLAILLESLVALMLDDLPGPGPLVP